jgi:uncharacterized protein (TIGR03435 family)
MQQSLERTHSDGFWFMETSGIRSSFFAATLGAQPPAPAFDVVSIRTVPPNTPPTNRDQDFTPVLPGGQYIDSRASLFFMIAFAYNVKNPATQMTGLPTWADDKSFAVAAKAAQDFPKLPPAENNEQVRFMMRAMLADRFHLQLHTETRQQRILKFETAKGGIKIKEVDPPVPPAREGNVIVVGANDGGGRMIGNKSTMAGLARAVTFVMNQPVVDETGLKGFYDFDVKWNGDGQPAGFGTAEFIGPLISNLQSRCGLRVTKATGPVEYWVVDHIEPPTDN